MAEPDSDNRNTFHDEMLRTFARGVAHNFNNILTAGMGFLSLAMDICQDREVITILRNVELCHQRISHLSRQLLSFTGDEESHLSVVRIYDVLRNSLTLFDAIALRHRAVLMCDFAEVRDVLVRVDEFRLVQALVQILKNAAESLGDSRGRITFKSRPTSDGVAIEISDTGGGIPAEMLEKIGSPFYTTKQVVGVGLGLSMAKAIIASFSGQLDICSTVGEGTTVRILLPAQNYEANGFLFSDQHGALRGGIKALVAVDGEETRQALEAVLLSYSLIVDSVENEDEFRKYLSRGGGHYDVIIADLLHSEMFGEDLVRLIREYSAAPVLALFSSVCEAPAPSDTVSALMKPFGADELLAALRSFPALLANSGEL